MPITRSGEAILKDVNEGILKLEAERARLFFKHERTGIPDEAILTTLHAMILRIKKSKNEFERAVVRGRNDDMMWKTGTALEEELIKVERNLFLLSYSSEKKKLTDVVCVLKGKETATAERDGEGVEGEEHGEVAGA